MSDNIKRTAAAAAAVIVCAAVFLLVPNKKEETVYIYDALGTVSEITVYGKNTDSLSLCREYVYKMDSLFSVTDPESEISRINRGERVKLSRETEEILNFSMKYADNETFNPFCGTLIELWDDAKAKNIPPKETDVTLDA